MLLNHRYRVQRPLGSGGGGQSYLATDETTGQTVVVKELYAPVVGPLPPQVPLLRQLDHPQVQSLIDVFTDEVRMVRRLHTVTRWVPGASLDEVARQRRLSQDEAAAIVGDVLDVVAWMHARSPPVLHRDLKPSNVILGEDGRVVLIDFDLATDAVDRTFQHTMAVGTLGYQAPEQIAGEPCAQSDVYSVGALALELWTRRAPVSLLDGQALDWRRVGAHLEPRWRAWLERALAPALNDRFASAKQARAALSDPNLGRPGESTSRPPSAPRPSLADRSPAPPEARHPPHASTPRLLALAAGGVVMVGFLAALLVFRGAEEAAPPAAVAAVVEPTPVGSAQDRCAEDDAGACLAWAATLRGRKGDPHAAVEAGQVFAQACLLGEGAGCWERARAHDRGGWLAADAAQSGRWWIEACLHNVTNACDNLRRVDRSVEPGALDAAYAAAIDANRAHCAALRPGDEDAAFRCSRAIRWLDEGRGEQTDPAAAFALAEEACAGGAAWACHRVARGLVEGDGAPVDRARALAVYDDLCEDDDTAACAAATRLRVQGG